MILTTSRAKRAAGVLARAFHGDPLCRFFDPDDAHRQRHLPHMFRLTVRDAILSGEVHATSPNLEAVAVWNLPKSGQVSVWRRIVAGFLSLRLRLDRSSFRSAFGEPPAAVAPAVEYQDTIHQRLAPFPHAYLDLIGVDPEFRGQGYAGALLRTMLARIDDEGLPCYLATCNPVNVPLYEHFGFEVVKVGTIPESDVGFWAMLREPQSVPTSTNNKA